MARWITIIAVISIGLNIGLASAVGFGLWQRAGHWELNEFRSFLKHDRDGDRGGGSIGRFGKPHGFKADRWAQQVVANCLPAIDAGVALTDDCAKVQSMLATLPKDQQGQPILPRRDDGQWDIKAIFDSAQPGMRGLARPERPNSLNELQRNLNLTDGQRDAFRSLLRDQSNARRALNQDLFSRKQALEAYLDQPDFAPAQALALYQGTLALRNRSLEDHAMRFLTFYESLDTTQRALLLDWTNNSVLSLLE